MRPRPDTTRLRPKLRPRPRPNNLASRPHIGRSVHATGETSRGRNLCNSPIVAVSASRSRSCSCLPVTSTAETRTENLAPVRSFWSAISRNSQSIAHGMMPRDAGESSTPSIVYVLPANQHFLMLWRFFSPPGSDSFRSKLMFYCRCFFSFYLFQREISELRRPIGTKFCTMIRRGPNFIMPIQNFGGLLRKNFKGQQHAKFGLISEDFKLRRRISPERMKIFKIGQVGLPHWLRFISCLVH